MTYDGDLIDEIAREIDPHAFDPGMTVSRGHARIRAGRILASVRERDHERLTDRAAGKTPIRVHVTEQMGARQPIDLDGADDLTAALLTHLQRIACEGARAAWAGAQAPEDWRTVSVYASWRAQINPDTAHLIHVVEETGIATFEYV